jgi:hypothetical protein
MAEKRYKGRKGFNIGKRAGSDGGISFQFPPGWDDGSGKVRHIPSGKYKGRVYFTSRQEAIDIGKRHEDVSGHRTEYDPD